MNHNYNFYFPYHLWVFIQFFALEFLFATVINNLFAFFFILWWYLCFDGRDLLWNTIKGKLKMVKIFGKRWGESPKNSIWADFYCKNCISQPFAELFLSTIFSINIVATCQQTQINATVSNIKIKLILKISGNLMRLIKQNQSASHLLKQNSDIATIREFRFSRESSKE